MFGLRTKQKLQQNAENTTTIPKIPHKVIEKTIAPYIQESNLTLIYNTQLNFKKKYIYES